METPGLNSHAQEYAQNPSLKWSRVELPNSKGYIIIKYHFIWFGLFSLVKRTQAFFLSNEKTVSRDGRLLCDRTDSIYLESNTWVENRMQKSLNPDWTGPWHQFTADFKYQARGRGEGGLSLFMLFHTFVHFLDTCLFFFLCYFTF